MANSKNSYYFQPFMAHQISIMFWLAAPSPCPHVHLHGESIHICESINNMTTPCDSQSVHKLGLQPPPMESSEMRMKQISGGSCGLAAMRVDFTRGWERYRVDDIEHDSAPSTYQRQLPLLL